MGWGSGYRLADAVWDIVKSHIPPSHKTVVARQLCEAFENEDCDTLQDCEELYDVAYSKSLSSQVGDK